MDDQNCHISWYFKPCIQAPMKKLLPNKQKINTQTKCMEHPCLREWVMKPERDILLKKTSPDTSPAVHSLLRARAKGSSQASESHTAGYKTQPAQDAVSC